MPDCTLWHFWKDRIIAFVSGQPTDGVMPLGELKMRFGKAAAGAALIGIAALGACAPQGMGPRQEVGIVSGALIGGTAGNLIGRGDAASTLAGALLGGIIGGSIGADLDQQEQRLAARAEFQALDTGRPMTWQGDRRDVRGEVIPGPRFSEGRQFCR